MEMRSMMGEKRPNCIILDEIDGTTGSEGTGAIDVLLKLCAKDARTGATGGSGGGGGGSGASARMDYDERGPDENENEVCLFLSLSLSLSPSLCIHVKSHYMHSPQCLSGLERRAQADP